MIDYNSNSIPVDRTAANVIKKGFSFNADFNEICTTEPLECKMYNGTKNLIGYKKGRLSVIGYRGKNSRKQAMWVCRCSCGNYFTRSSRVLLGTEDKLNFMCPECKFILRKQKKYNKKTSRRPLSLLYDMKNNHVL